MQNCKLARPQFTKLARKREALVHATISKQFPKLTAPFCHFQPMDGEVGTLIMQDLAAFGCVRMEDALRERPNEAWSLSRQLCKQLVLLHSAFVGDEERAHFLSLKGKPNPARVEQLQKKAAALLARGDLPGLGRDFVSRAAAIVRLLSEDHTAVRGVQRPTLLHGDLHFRNVLVSPGGEMYLIDWGEACWGNVCWELAMLPEPFLRVYWECARLTSLIPDALDDFLHAHRWFATCRALDLLDVICIQLDAGNKKAMPALYVVVDRLAKLHPM